MYKWLKNNTALYGAVYDGDFSKKFGLFDEAGDAGGGSGGGAGDPDFDLAKVLANPKAKAAIDAYAEREIVAPIKAKNSELLDKMSKYKIKVMKDGKEVESYLDPSEAVAAIERVKSGQAPEVKEEVERALAGLQKTHDAEKAELTKAVQEKDRLVITERDARYNLMLANALRTALTESKIKVEKMHLHEMYLRGFLRIAAEGGTEQIQIIDEAGKVRYGSTGLMSLAEMVNEYRDRKGVAEDWQPTMRGGSGTGAGAGGGNRAGMAIDMTLSPAERMKQFRAQTARR